ncbi:MAG: transcription termination/antitermination NusG family protein [Algisphaera sp.]
MTVLVPTAPTASLIPTCALDNPDARWHVLHVRSNQEFAVSKFMQALGAGVFFPTLRKPPRRDKHRGHAESPAFQGYVFVHACDQMAYEADRTRRLVQIITVHNQERIAQEIAGLEITLAAQPLAQTYPALKIGLAVRVVSGPMAGVHGIIASRSQAHRLFLNVETLGQSIGVEVDAQDLEVLND